MSVEDLLAALHKATGAKLEKDDPILIAAFLANEVAFSALETAVQQAVARITEANAAAHDQAKSDAAALITQAAEWHRDRIKESVAEGLKAVDAALARLRETQEAVRGHRKATVAAAWVAGISAAGAGAAWAGWVAAQFWVVG
jgi:hypothetical protein